MCSKSPKKVTAAVFGNDSSLVAFADKFGDIHTAKIQSEMGQADPSAFPLLGHLCSIVTSLAFSLDGKHLVSTDQDCKVRVSTMPSEPQKVSSIGLHPNEASALCMACGFGALCYVAAAFAFCTEALHIVLDRVQCTLQLIVFCEVCNLFWQGAHSIQSICMGHQVFAKCCAFISTKQSAHPLLLSGGGDSTVRSAQRSSCLHVMCICSGLLPLHNHNASLQIMRESGESVELATQNLCRLTMTMSQCSMQRCLTNLCNACLLIAFPVIYPLPCVRKGFFHHTT